MLVHPPEQWPIPHVPVSHTATWARTLGEMFALRVARHPDRPAFYHKEEGTWRATSWKQFFDAAGALAHGFTEKGLAAGSRIAIGCATGPTWAIADMACQLAGFTSVGIYANQTADDVRYLLTHCRAAAVIVDSAREMRVVDQAMSDLPHAIRIVAAHPEALAAADPEREIDTIDGLMSYPSPRPDWEARQASIDPNAPALIIYTSGTTGRPKGAVIGHRQVLALLGSQSNWMDLFEDDISLSFLPMAHSAERILAFYGRISAGLATAYATSPATVLAEMAEVRPTLFGCVPRILEKAYAQVCEALTSRGAMGERLLGMMQATAPAWAHARIEGQRADLGLRLRHALLERLVYRRVRETFGGRVREMVVGAAPTAPHILSFFWAAGLPVYEAYGQTEATVVTHANAPRAVRLGTVGRVLAPMEHRIADDGEVLVRGPWVFSGYLDDPVATADVLHDGWLHTGDIGVIDADGYLRITDRKKHIVITAGGKNLAPARLEAAVKRQDSLVSHVHVHADRRPYVSALIAPSPLETLSWGASRGIISSAEVHSLRQELLADPTRRSERLELAMRSIATHPELQARVAAAVQRANSELAGVEQIRRVVVLARDFAVERGELTPTLKLKRKAIEHQFESLFDRIYDESGFALEVGP